jgi:hypothetical protein
MQIASHPKASGPIGRQLILACALLLAAGANAQSALADRGVMHVQAASGVPSVRLPLVVGWYDGQEVLYLTTDVSDKQAALDMGVNYVPRLANAINSSPGSVDDIFAVTNFTQGNIIPSAPLPTGPGNLDPEYSPLWQVSTVTWNPGVTPYLLRSESEVMAAAASGLVTIAQTNIVVNCPVIYTPQGGLLPNAKVTRGAAGH